MFSFWSFWRGVQRVQTIQDIVLLTLFVESYILVFDIVPISPFIFIDE